jgi:hypothetical protein
MADAKLTLSTDENPLKSLFAGDRTYRIPLFQRPYRWKAAKIKRLQEDLSRLADSDGELHFMGAVIVHEVIASFAHGKTFELIDGQQRMTSVYLHIAGAASILADDEESCDLAWALISKYLINSEFVLRERATFKLQPSREDREPLNQVMTHLMSKRNLAGIVEDNRLQLKLLDQLGPVPSKLIGKNFKLAEKFFRKEFAEGGQERVQLLIETLLDNLSVVWINVKDPLSGPKIFDSLNSQQEKMTVGDLVRNDIFARVQPSNETLEDVEEHGWKPFFEAFGDPQNDAFENYFFPYGLMQDPSAKKSEIYQRLRDSWVAEDLSANQVIDRLSEFQPDYMQFQDGSTPPEMTKDVSEVFKRFYNMGVLGVSLPFLMKLSYKTRKGDFDPKQCKEILCVVESFLVRRQACGDLASGMHVIFKDLWADAAKLDGGVIGANVHKVLHGHRAYKWPNDEEFSNAIKERKLYGLRVTDFILLELNRSLGGDFPNTKDFWTEHVLPQSPADGWGAFSGEQRVQMTNRLANLIPLSPEGNNGVSNDPYSEKRPIYLHDSKYKMARQFAETYSEWTPREVEERGRILADQCVARWPFGPLSD